jgi:hypothetical protein
VLTDVAREFGFVPPECTEDRGIQHMRNYAQIFQIADVKTLRCAYSKTRRSVERGMAR